LDQTTLYPKEPVMKKLILVVALLLSASAADAEYNIKDYKKYTQDPETKELLSNYITGMGRGYFWVNALLGTKGIKELFCIPEGLILDKEVISSLLAQEIREPINGNVYREDDPIELILLNSLIYRFPCAQP